MIREWSGQWPDANIGIATGSRSGLVVLDVDGPMGEASLLDLCGNPLTPVSLTGRGRHLFFEHYGGPVANRVGLLGQKLDLRGEGGYVVAPPSLHVSGHRYRWDTEQDPGVCPLAPLPSAILDLLPRAKVPPVRVDISSIKENLTEGSRNDKLTRYAGRLLGLGLPHNEVRTLCVALNALYGKPPLSEREVTRIVASIANREATNGGRETPEGDDQEEDDDESLEETRQERRTQAQLIIGLARDWADKSHSVLASMAELKCSCRLTIKSARTEPHACLV